MSYNRYGLNIIIRSLILFFSLVLFAFLIFKTDRFFSLLFIGSLIIVQVVLLIHYLNGINRDLARFLIYLQENDTSLKFDSEKIERNFKGINQGFKLINTQFEKIKIDRETKIHFLNNVVNHMKVAFMAYDQNGRIALFNNASKKLFAREYYTLEEIKNENKAFFQFLSELPSNFNGIYNYGSIAGENWPLLVRSSGFVLAGDEIRLVSFQNIKSQLDSNEMESWQKLMRVLAHEISNSITPITMLGNTIRRHLETTIGENSGQKQFAENIVTDMIRCAELIEQRGNRLIEFIDSYKSYAKLPQPEIKKVLVKDLFSQIEKYFDEQFVREKVEFNSSFVAGTIMKIDLSLIEQVLINLIQNSIQALQTVENRKIILTHKRLNGNTIEVSDNGVGIPTEIQDKIFIPFFTTKQNGSGIGLSLSKNIMHMHRGSIKLQPVSKNMTSVCLNFPE